MNNSQYTDSTAEYLYKKGEYINTIFWFVHEQAVYEEAWKNHWVAPRTIAFCYDTRAIMLNGLVYGSLDYSKFLEYIKNIAGRLLLWNNSTNKIDVDYDALVNELLHDTTFMEGVFTYLLQNHKASKDTWGIVKVGDGIKVSDGVISIDFGGGPNNPTDLDQWLINFIKNRIEIRASKTEYGVVRIGDGIDVNNGIISVNWNDPNNPGNNTSGSNVTITPILLSGVKIADFTIDGASGSLYAPLGNGGGGLSGNTTLTTEQIEHINTYITEQINNLSSDVLNFIDGDWLTYFDQHSWSTEELNLIIEHFVDTLNSFGWESIFATSGWSEDFSTYITQIGLITLDTEWEYTDGSGRITTLLMSDIILRLNSINNLVERINVITDSEGKLVNINDLETLISQLIAEDSAMIALKSQILDWDTDSQTIDSALAYFVQKVRLTATGLLAFNNLYAGIVLDNIMSLTSLKQIADADKATQSLVSTFGTYDELDPWMKYTGTNDVQFDVDENGRAIPYTGVILKAQRTSDDGWELYDTSKATGYYKTAKDLDGNVIKDESGNDLIKQLAVRVFYKVEPGTDDYAVYSSNNHGYYEESDLPHDSKGEIIWQLSDYHGIYFIKEHGKNDIAYHKKRKFNIATQAGLLTEAGLDSAMAQLLAQNVNSLTKTSLINAVTESSAWAELEASAGNTLYDDSKYAKVDDLADASTYLAKLEYRTDVDRENGGTSFTLILENEGENDDAWLHGTVTRNGELVERWTIYDVRYMRDADSKVLYWQQYGTVDQDGTVRLKWYGEGGSPLWMNPSTGEISTTQGTGYVPVKKMKKGSLSQSALKLASDANSTSATMSSRLGDVEASVSTAATYRTDASGNYIITNPDNPASTILISDYDSSTGLHTYRLKGSTNTYYGPLDREIYGNVYISADRLTINAEVLVVPQYITSSSYSPTEINGVSGCQAAWIVLNSKTMKNIIVSDPPSSGYNGTPTVILPVLSSDNVNTVLTIVNATGINHGTGVAIDVMSAPVQQTEFHGLISSNTTVSNKSINIPDNGCVTIYALEKGLAGSGLYYWMVTSTNGTSTNNQSYGAPALEI